MTTAAPDYRRPESVLVVIFTGVGDVLLLKRRRPFEFWQSVTGSLRYGETHAVAAKRELCEETGLTDQGELIFTGSSRQFTIDSHWSDRFAPGVVENVEYEYRYKMQERVEISLSEDEHSELLWLPIAEAASRVWSWTNKQAIDQLKVAS